jgi:hypothetical protein
MKNYIGSKFIKATPKTYGEYKKIKYGDKPFESNIADEEEGYLVVYPAIGEKTERHTSWSPKKIFEIAYREVDEDEYILMMERN